MKSIVQLVTSLICFAAWQASVHGAVKYWDIDGSTPGAGGSSPAGIWDAGTTANWTTDANGSTSGTTWVSGDDAVFSAGSDATGVFSVTLDNTASPPVQNAGNLTVEEGSLIIVGGSGLYLNVGGGLAGKGIINIASGASAIINAPLDDTYAAVGNDAGLLTKTGTGTLTLSSNSFHGSTTIVAEGVLVVTDIACLGNTLVPTVISNGASLQIDTNNASPNTFRNEPLNVNGNGFGNGGAVRSIAGCRIGGGGITLDSASRLTSVVGEFRVDQWTPDRNFDVTFDGNGNHRLNVVTAGGYSLGTGKLIKEGTGWVQTEGISYKCGAVEFNDGIFRFRELPGGGFKDAANVNFVSFTIGPDADEFRTVLQNNITVGNDITLNATNLVMNLVSNSQITLSGVVSGPSGGLTKGTDLYSQLNLNNHHTYGGNTTVRGGIANLGASGSISNSAVIDVWTNGVFNVTSNLGGFVLQPAQTLKGDGTVLGNVTALGAISPGNSVGSLTNDGSLTLAGGILIDVDKSLSPGSSNDLITVTGSLTHSGGASVTVANLGPALAVGDNFKIFSKAVTGGGTITVTGAGATWANNLAADGSITVTAVTPAAVAATNVTIQAAGPTSYNLGGLGAASSVYDVYAATNIAIPASNWWKIGSTNSTAGGVIQFLDSQATNKQRFYRFGQTVP